MRLLTPKRLKENEAFMCRQADRQIDEFVGDGHCEFISAYSQPFAMLVVADVLGVPEVDHQRFRHGFGLSGSPGQIGGGGEGDGAQRTRMARRLVRQLHRGPPPRAARRRAHRPGPRHLPRRFHT